MNVLLMALPLLIGSCSDDNNSYNDPATVPTDIIQTVVKTTADLSLTVTTDKAAYKPGETVRFNVTDGTLPASARIRYRHGSEVIADENLGSTSWTWTAPQADYTGYMADIYTADGNNQQTIYATIGVDVSSDWARFPRYGFIASYGSDPLRMLLLPNCLFSTAATLMDCSSTIGNTSSIGRSAAHQAICSRATRTLPTATTTLRW